MDTQTSKPARHRRTASFWEPMYDSDSGEFVEGQWSFRNQLGPSMQTFSNSGLEEAVRAGLAPRFKGIAFTDCDFFGYFDQLGKVITFRDCTFTRCDFGLTTWWRVKFTDCKFIRTSFTQSTFRDSEFRGCDWEHVGLSGNETKLDGTFIDNPDKFIESAYTNLDPIVLKKNKTTPEFQKTRLSETKATVARTLYNNLKLVGDEETFYRACKVYTRQSVRSRIDDQLYALSEATSRGKKLKQAAQLVPSWLDFCVVNGFGSMNRWGGSLTRPLIGLLFTWLVFSGIYAVGFKIEWMMAIARSFEITVVAGYTKGAVTSEMSVLRLLEWLNLLTGIVFYTVFFATVVAKISRVR